MADRLFVGVLGNRNAGKSHTWNTLFNRTVRRGTQARPLTLRPGECVDVFLVSGSLEERQEYAGEILDNQDCRIVLCSMQYTDEVRRTLDYVVERAFDIYIQWLNPGFSDLGETWDRLGLVDQILAHRGLIALRTGQGNANDRVQEIREFIYGWALFRGLIHAC
jgi:hypothetical protein